MKEYKCNTCGKIFDRLSNYNNHNNRKFKCRSLNVTDNNIDNNIDLTTMLHKFNEMANKIINVERENETLKEELALLKKSTNIIKNTTLNNSNNTQNIETVNIQILLNAFGKEDLSHLNNKQIKEILDNGFNSIPKYIDYVHYNKDAPKNNNICITNKRDDTVNVFDGDQWTLRNKKDFMDDIKNKGVEFIEQQLDKLDKNKKYDQLILKKINRFIDWFHNYDDNETEDETERKKKKENKEKLIQLNKKIELLLYNGRKHIKNMNKINKML